MLPVPATVRNPAVRAPAGNDPVETPAPGRWHRAVYWAMLRSGTRVPGAAIKARAQTPIKRFINAPWGP